jgi:hypothetical protein
MAKLTAGFVTSSRSTVIVPFSRRATIRGRLTSISGSAIGKALIDVFERPVRAGAKEVALGRVTTGVDGSFSYTLAARRPSRSVRLAYGSLASSRLLNVRVRAASVLKATLRGTLLRFSGRVLSRPLPTGGSPVVSAWPDAGREPGTTCACACRPSAVIRISLRLAGRSGCELGEARGRPPVPLPSDFSDQRDIEPCGSSARSYGRPRSNRDGVLRWQASAEAVISGAPLQTEVLE